MREFLQKLQIKGFIAGFLVAAILVAAVFSVANNTSIREVIYGVNVVINGNRWNPPEDMQPFISDGRTFLPVRGIGQALDVPIDWDEETFTVFIGDFSDDWSTSPEKVVFVGGDGTFIMTGAYVESASVVYDFVISENPQQRFIEFNLTEEGRQAFAIATTRLAGMQGQNVNENFAEMAAEANPELFPNGVNVGPQSVLWNSVAVILDGYVIAAPRVQAELNTAILTITGGTDGGFDMAEAEHIVRVLNSGGN